MSSIRLTRALPSWMGYPNSPGRWVSTDQRYLFYWSKRVGARGYWTVTACSSTDFSLLKRHGLHTARFPTRRAALARLEDVLDLEVSEES